MKVYEIVHIQQDKTEVVLKETTDEHDIYYVTETAKYAGTWINDHQKVLRFQRGMIVVRVKPEVIVQSPMRIVNHHVVTIGRMKLYELHVIYGDDLDYIRLDERQIVGYNSERKQLWRYTSFTDLADKQSKELSFLCNIYYERFLEEFNLRGAI